MKNPEKQWIKKVFSDAAVPEKLFIKFFWPKNTVSFSKHQHVKIREREKRERERERERLTFSVSPQQPPSV